MTFSTWIRAAALGALLVLASHAAAGLAHQHDPRAGQDCALCQLAQVVALEPESPGAPPSPVPAGALVPEPRRSPRPAAPRQPPPRGPPA